MTTWKVKSEGRRQVLPKSPLLEGGHKERGWGAGGKRLAWDVELKMHCLSRCYIEMDNVSAAYGNGRRQCQKRTSHRHCSDCLVCRLSSISLVTQ